MARLFPFLLLGFASLMACQPPLPEVAAPATFAEKLERAHRKEAFQQHEAITFDLVLNFAGRERFNGPITLSTDSYRGLFGYPDSSQVYFEGQQLYQDVDTTQRKHGRFGAYTWSYFFALPYKLSDAGTQFSAYADKQLDGKTYEVEKLSFAAGTGDAPDDWYLLFADPETMQLEASAYIVTAGRTRAEAEKSPSAIDYADYRLVDGIPIAHEWRFYKFEEGKGFSGEQRGSGRLSNIRFLTAAEASWPDKLSDWTLVE